MKNRTLTVFFLVFFALWSYDFFIYRKAGEHIALRLRVMFDPNTVEGEVTDIKTIAGEVRFMFANNRSADGVVIEYNRLRDPRASMAAIGGGQYGIMAHLLSIGEEYRGKRIYARGKMEVREDGSRMLVVQSRDCIRIVEPAKMVSSSD